MSDTLVKLVRLLKPKRRWVQFSLGTMLVLVTALCAVLAMIVVPAERQRLAKAAIKAAGGRIAVGSRMRLLPSVVKRWIPGDYLSEVQEVFLQCDGSGDADAALGHLSALTELRFLELHRSRVTDRILAQCEALNDLEVLGLWFETRVTDAGLEHLPGTELRTLTLSHTQVAGAGLAHLQSLKQLHWTSHPFAPITDAGLANLRRLTNLRQVSLINTKITDAGLAHLSGLTNLERLCLDGTRVTDTGLMQLKALTNLERLDLRNTRIIGTGLDNLADLKALGELDLTNSDVTDAGLVHLHHCQALKWVNLSGTKVTKTGVEQLKQALPRCKIVW